MNKVLTISPLLLMGAVAACQQSKIDDRSSSNSKNSAISSIDPLGSSHSFPVPDDFYSGTFLISKRRALQGSATDAGQVIEGFGNCKVHYQEGLSTEKLPSLAKCISEFNYWKRVGLENRNISQMTVKYNTLRDSQMCEDVNRSIFWLKEIIKVFPKDPWKSELRAQRLAADQCRLN